MAYTQGFFSRNAGEHNSRTSGTKCNGKGCGGVLQGLLMMAVGGSIVTGRDLFLHG